MEQKGNLRGYICNFGILQDKKGRFSKCIVDYLFDSSVADSSVADSTLVTAFVIFREDCKIRLFFIPAAGEIIFRSLNPITRFVGISHRKKLSTQSNCK